MCFIVANFYIVFIYEKCYYISFYKTDIVFYFSFFYNNKIRYNNKSYNKYFRIEILISITKPLGENLCIGFNNPFSQVLDSPLNMTIEIDKSMVTIHT